MRHAAIPSQPRRLGPTGWRGVGDGEGPLDGRDDGTGVGVTGGVDGLDQKHGRLFLNVGERFGETVGKLEPASAHPVHGRDELELPLLVEC